MRPPPDPVTAARRARLFALARQESCAARMEERLRARRPQPPELIHQFRAAAAASLRAEDA